MTLLSALLLFVAPHGLLVPRLPLSRRACLRCKDPVAALPRPVLDPLAEAAEKAVTDSTGAGEESSGSGRPEWGTWCDSELFAEVKSCLNRVALHTAEGDAWGGLWEAVGGEAPSGGEAGGDGGSDLGCSTFAGSECATTLLFASIAIDALRASATRPL